MTLLRNVFLTAAVLAMSQTALASGGGGSGGGGGRPAAPRGGGPSGQGYVAPAQSDYEKAEYLIKSGSYNDAIPLLESIIRDNPNEADSLNYLGYANRKTGNYKTAFVYYQRALKADPDHRGAHEYLGELYLQIGDTANAEAQLVELKRICAVICEEREDLAAQIADYKTQHPAGTPQAAGKGKPKAAVTTDEDLTTLP